VNFHEDFVIKSSPTGSNYICNPPVMDTDIDTVFLVHQQFYAPGAEVPIKYSDILSLNGWTPCVGEGSEVLGGDFTAWRKGNKNYICTTDPVYYNKYVKATKICKMLNLLNKEDRIFMFKLVMGGTGLPSNSPPPVPAPAINWFATGVDFTDLTTLNSE
jgi:hypothetical protein